MRTVDFSPLWRSTIGFDRLFDLVETAQGAGEDNYPPYNIERLGDNRFQISLAVAGFSPDEIAMTAEQNVLTLEGGKKTTTTSANISIAASRLGRSSASSPLPTMSQVQAARVRERPAEHRAAAGNPRGDEAAPDRHQRPGASDRSRKSTPPRRPDCRRPRVAARGLLQPRHRQEAPCGRRPLPRRKLLIFDFNALVHPGHGLRTSTGRGCASRA